MPNRFSSVSIRRMMRQPGWWAAASSLGFHGLLFMLLPLLPTPPSLGDDIDSRTVSVFELSSADTERLPNFLESELSLPPLPDAPAPEGQQTLELEPYKFDLGPNIVESQRQFEQAPRSSASYSFPSIFPNLPDPSVFERRQSVVIPPPPQRPQQRPQLDIVPIQPSPPQVVDEAPSPTAPEQGTAADLRSPNGQETPAEQPDADADAGSSGAAPEEPSQVARASDPAPPERIELSEEQQQAYNRLYGYSASGTSAGEAQVAATTWLTEGLGLSISEVDILRNPLRMSINYPKDACAIGADEGSLVSYYGVVLGDDGTVSSEPVLVRSSGYGVLNLEGKAAAAGQTFEEASGPALVGVEFVYSDANCSVSEAIARDEAGQ